MKILLTLKHWQLFLLVGIAPIMSSFVDQNTFLFDLANFLFIVSFLGWMYSLGTNLHEKLPIEVKMNLFLFKFLLLVTLIYGTVVNFFVLGTFGDHEFLLNANAATVGLLVLFHLLSMFGMFYGLYFNAKALKSVTHQRAVVFNDFSKSFFLMWFFPIGIWFVQPVINKLFEDKTQI